MRPDKHSTRNRGCWSGQGAEIRTHATCGHGNVCGDDNLTFHTALQGNECATGRSRRSECKCSCDRATEWCGRAAKGKGSKTSWRCRASRRSNIKPGLGRTIAIHVRATFDHDPGRNRDGAGGGGEGSISSSLGDEDRGGRPDDVGIATDKSNGDASRRRDILKCNGAGK